MALVLRVLWLLTLALQVVILLMMTGKKQYRDFPAIYSYLLIGLAESPLLYFVYALKGFDSSAAYWTAWSAQAVVVLARWIAVCELCYSILGQFRGVWALTWRVLALFGAATLSAAILLGGHDYTHIVNTFDLGLEFSIATVLAVFFAFTRFYDIYVLPSLRSMGIAFGLYSCFRAANDTVLQRLLHGYVATWSVIDGVTYLATLTLIASAVYALHAQPGRTVKLFPQQVYAQFVPPANDRLAALNKRLQEMLKGETGGQI